MPRKRPTESSWDSDEDLLKDDSTSSLNAFPPEKDLDEVDEDALLGGSDDEDTERQRRYKKSENDLQLDDCDEMIELEVDDIEYSDDLHERSLISVNDNLYETPSTKEEKEETADELSQFEQHSFVETSHEDVEIKNEEEFERERRRRKKADDNNESESENDDDDDDSRRRGRFRSERTDVVRLPTSQPKTTDIPETLEISKEDQEQIDQFMLHKPYFKHHRHQQNKRGGLGRGGGGPSRPMMMVNQGGSNPPPSLMGQPVQLPLNFPYIGSSIRSRFQQQTLRGSGNNAFDMMRARSTGQMFGAGDGFLGGRSGENSPQHKILINPHFRGNARLPKMEQAWQSDPDSQRTTQSLLAPPSGNSFVQQQQQQQQQQHHQMEVMPNQHRPLMNINFLQRQQMIPQHVVQQQRQSSPPERSFMNVTSHPLPHHHQNNNNTPLQLQLQQGASVRSNFQQTRGPEISAFQQQQQSAMMQQGPQQQQQQQLQQQIQRQPLPTQFIQTRQQQPNMGQLQQQQFSNPPPQMQQQPQGNFPQPHLLQQVIIQPQPSSSSVGIIQPQTYSGQTPQPQFQNRQYNRVPTPQQQQQQQQQNNNFRLTPPPPNVMNQQQQQMRSFMQPPQSIINMSGQQQQTTQLQQQTHHDQSHLPMQQRQEMMHGGGGTAQQLLQSYIHECNQQQEIIGQPIETVVHRKVQGHHMNTNLSKAMGMHMQRQGSRLLPKNHPLLKKMREKTNQSQNAISLTEVSSAVDLEQNKKMEDRARRFAQPPPVILKTSVTKAPIKRVADSSFSSLEPSLKTAKMTTTRKMTPTMTMLAQRREQQQKNLRQKHLLMQKNQSLEQKKKEQIEISLSNVVFDNVKRTATEKTVHDFDADLQKGLEHQKQLREEILRRKEQRRQLQAVQRRKELEERLRMQGLSDDQIKMRLDVESPSSSTSSSQLPPLQPTVSNVTPSVSPQVQLLQTVAAPPTLTDKKKPVKKVVVTKAQYVAMLQQMEKTKEIKGKGFLSGGSNQNQMLLMPRAGVLRGPSPRIRPNQTPYSIAPQTNLPRRVVIGAGAVMSSLVAIEGLATSTTSSIVRHLAEKVGPVQSVEFKSTERKAFVKFQNPEDALSFEKRFNRHMIDLSMITVSVVPQSG